MVNAHFLNPIQEGIKENILDRIGNTPMLNFKLPDNDKVNLYAKLEGMNPTGSIKARPARYILGRAFDEGIIKPGDAVIESSSGNFGLALAAYCKKMGLHFICVADPYISEYNRQLILYYGAEIIMVDTPDEGGGYLLNRVRKIKELLVERKDLYWINQYANKWNAETYYCTLGQEISNEVEHLDYAFIGVSSGGTITGLSKKLRERYPGIRIVAVDAIGSKIFGMPPQKRNIPGIGSSMRPEILNDAHIDEAVHISELETIESCLSLLRDHYLFLGGSSGTAYAGVHEYFKQNPPIGEVNALLIFPDGGEKYFDTIYNATWRQKITGISIL